MSEYLLIPPVLSVSGVGEGAPVGGGRGRGAGVSVLPPLLRSLPSGSSCGLGLSPSPSLSLSQEENQRDGGCPPSPTIQRDRPGSGRRSEGDRPTAEEHDTGWRSETFGYILLVFSRCSLNAWYLFHCSCCSMCVFSTRSFPLLRLVV